MCWEGGLPGDSSASSRSVGCWQTWLLSQKRTAQRQQRCDPSWVAYWVAEISHEGSQSPTVLRPVLRAAHVTKALGDRGDVLGRASDEASRGASSDRGLEDESASFAVKPDGGEAAVFEDDLHLFLGIVIDGAAIEPLISNVANGTLDPIPARK